MLLPRNLCKIADNRLHPDSEVAITETQTLTKIELAALETAETVRQASGRDYFTADEVKEIVDDKRPFGFNISDPCTTVTVTRR